MFIKLFLFFFVFQYQSRACDCEQIKRQEYCYNPNCIQWCGLEDFFEDINKPIIKQCLPGIQTKEVFKQNPLSLRAVPGFLGDIKKEINEKESTEKKILKKNCPHCSLFPEFKFHFALESSKKICPEQYIKNHKYQKAIKFERKNSKCNKDKAMVSLQNYVKSVMGKDASPEAQQLWADCPDPCSFDNNFSIRINEEDCVGAISLNVLCSHPHRGFLGVPIYNASVEYKRALQCKAQ